ncbi:MAG: hypothetical protein WDO15_13495 [Bacteroidota bacterium]
MGGVGITFGRVDAEINFMKNFVTGVEASCSVLENIICCGWLPVHELALKLIYLPDRLFYLFVLNFEGEHGIDLPRFNGHCAGG